MYPVKAVLIFSAADEVLISFVLNPLLGDPWGRFFLVERETWKAWKMNGWKAYKSHNFDMEDMEDDLNQTSRELCSSR